MARFFKTKQIKKKLSPKRGTTAKQAFTQLRSNPEELRKAAAKVEFERLKKSLIEENKRKIQERKLQTLDRASSGEQLARPQQKRQPFNLDTFFRQSGRKAIDAGKNLASRYYRSQKPGIDFAADLSKDMFKRTPVAGLLLNPDRVKDITGDENFKREDNPFYKAVTGQRLSKDDAQDFFDVATGSGLVAGTVRGVGRKVGKELFEEASERAVKKASKGVQKIRPQERKAVFAVLDDLAPTKKAFDTRDLSNLKDASLDAIGASKKATKVGKPLRDIKENKVNTLISEWMKQNNKRYDIDDLLPTGVTRAPQITRRGREIADDLGLDLSTVQRVDNTTQKLGVQSQPGKKTISSRKQQIELEDLLNQQGQTGNRSNFLKDDFSQTKSGKAIRDGLDRSPIDEAPLPFSKTFDDINKLTDDSTTKIAQSQGKVKNNDVRGLRKIQKRLDERKTFQGKVSILDKFATPERTMKRVGLGDEVVGLRRAETKAQTTLPAELRKVEAWKKQAERVGDKDTPLRIFQHLDGDKAVKLAPEEQKIANEIKAYYKQWADRLGIPEEGRITDYVTHIFEKGEDFGEFPAEVAKMIRGKVAKSVFNPFQLSRSGKQTGLVRNPFLALEAYVKRANRKIYMDPALERFERGVRQRVDDVDMLDHIEKFISGVNYRPTSLDKKFDNTVKQVLGSYAPNRPTAAVTRRFRKLVYWATIALNPKTALKNLTQGVNTYSQLGERYTLEGYLRMAADLKNIGDASELRKVGVLDNQFVEMSSKGVSLKRKALNLAEDVGFSLFNFAERINRGAAYFGAKQRALNKGLSEEKAIEAGLDMARKTQFTFGAVDTPVGMQGDFAKTFLQFQSFNIKQLEFLSDLLSAPKKALDEKGLKEAAKQTLPIVRFLGATTIMLATVGDILGIKNWRDVLPAPDVTGTPAADIATSGFKSVFGNDFERDKAKEDFGESLRVLIPGKVAADRLVQTAKSRGVDVPEPLAELFGAERIEKGAKFSKAGFKEFEIPQDTGTAIQTGLFGVSSLKSKGPLDSLVERIKGQDPEKLSEAQKFEEYNFFDATKDYEKILSDFKSGKISETEAKQKKADWINKAQDFDQDPEYIESYVKQGASKEAKAEDRKEAYLILNRLRDTYPDKTERNRVYQEMIESGEISKSVHNQIKFLVSLEKK